MIILHEAVYGQNRILVKTLINMLQGNIYSLKFYGTIKQIEQAMLRKGIWVGITFTDFK